MRVRIKEITEDKGFLVQMGFKFNVVYKGIKKDNGYIEVKGLEFKESELEILE